MWRNDSYMGTDPAIAVDNITITGVACAQPVNMTVTYLDTSSATITFTPATSSDAAWELMYGESDTTMVTEGLTATTFTIQNLTPGTYYNAYVRTICSDGDTSAWSPAVSFQTECAPINSVPRFWDVETNNLGGTANYPLPTCWDRGPASGSYPYISYYEAYSGTIDISQCIVNVSPQGLIQFPPDGKITAIVKGYGLTKKGGNQNHDYRRTERASHRVPKT